jgi:hypothetical protein
MTDPLNRVEMIAEIRRLNGLLNEAKRRAVMLAEREQAERVAEAVLIDKLTAAGLRAQTLLRKLRAVRREP